MRYGKSPYLFKRAHTAIYWLPVMINFALPEGKVIKLLLERKLHSPRTKMKYVPGISS